jgi:hypothetical protein
MPSAVPPAASKPLDELKAAVAAGLAVVEAERAVVEAAVADAELTPSRGSAAMRRLRFAPRALIASMGLLLALCLAAGHQAPAVAAPSASAPVHQMSFSSPEEALKALIDALKAGNLSAVTRMFGPEIEPILHSGDPVADRNTREKFVAWADGKHHFDGSGDTLTLVIGKDDWPFPIPLKKTDGHWRFDTAAGKEEILDRRIGENELSTIQTVLAYVDAQRDYAELQRQQSGVAEYAQRILSTRGEKDGLFWPTAEGEPPSPFGPLVASAHAAGYRRGAKGAGPTPYHGYYFKVLTSQGPDADGGAAEYIVNGRMIGGFALVAWPARWGDSGVMTFIVNHEGVVYQTNLGPQTAELAPAIRTFDPDSSWQKAQ